MAAESEAAEKAHSEAALQKLVEVISRSQSNYRELIDNLDQAVFTLSPQGEILVANRRFSEIIGAPFSEFIGRSFAEFIDSPTLEEAKRALPELQSAGCRKGSIAVRLKKDGSVRHFSCWFQFVPQGGQLAVIIGWARDATAEHEAEIRFAELFASLREGMFFAAPDGRLRDANPALVRMLGYAGKEQLLGKNLRELYADGSALDEVMRELGSGKSVEDREFILRRADGKKVYCRGSVVGGRDELKRIAGIQGILADVTERLEIERRLQQEQEFVRRLIANFPDVIAVLDADGRYTYVSPRAEDLLGIAPHEFMGEEVTSRVHPDDVAKLDAVHQQLLAGATPQVQVEFRLRHRDGSWRTLRANAGPLHDGERISGAVASARDVTDSKRVEEQLASSEKFAAMGQMLAGAAHELNNPLTAILGVGDLLRERAKDDSSRRHAEIVLQQAKRAADIVQDLLAFSRPPTQGRSKIDLAELVRKILDTRKAELRSRNITVHFSAPEGLPGVEADAKLISQVLVNIVNNAEQAMAAARDRGNLNVSLEEAGEKVILTIADDGPGISAEDMPKIFDPFFTTKRPGGGTGLGLTISMVVVREHGGTIEVQSRPGAGATFRILLPAAPGTSTGAGKGVQSGSALLKGRSALVVDDEESIREIVQEGLRARGLRVDGAESVQAALGLLGGHSYDFIVCDFNLPGQRGTELFERVRGTPSQPSQAFVFVTGDLVEPAKAAELKKQGAHVLQKPFQVSALAALLTDLLQPQTAGK